MEKLREWIQKEKLKHIVQSWANILLNPKLLLCLFIAWMITNGWSYVLMLIGFLLKINWMKIVAGAYMSLLWIPFTPEKIITVALAILLLRVLYPKDEKTLGALKAKMHALKIKLKKQKIGG